MFESSEGQHWKWDSHPPSGKVGNVPNRRYPFEPMGDPEVTDPVPDKGDRTLNGRMSCGILDQCLKGIVIVDVDGHGFISDVIGLAHEEGG